MTTTERATLALWLVMERPMTTAELSRWLNMSWHGADKLLCRMSRMAPLVKVNGHWTIMRRQDVE